MDENRKILTAEEELSLRRRMDIFMGLGQYKRAQSVADDLGLKIKIQDNRGTQYYIAEDGSVRRVIPKFRRRKRR